ncbi:MAG: BadF/BadG/BcrA/BcrD ATPase family protein [Nibricoccus sp.]
MTLFLGIDGGGTKTGFSLIDATGRVLAERRAGPAYHVEIGMQGLRQMLKDTALDMLASQSKSPDDLTFAFVGLPGYGENSELLPQLDQILDGLLPRARYRCGNDIVCGWAGALAGAPGIAVVAGTGSIAYGEHAGRSARSGGWGELFGDEGSAYWLAREALTLFARMDDRRAPKGPLHQLVCDHFGVTHGLDVCARVYGPPTLSRSEFAALAPLLTQAAQAGDVLAHGIFEAAAREIASLVHAVRDALQVDSNVPLAVSYCGGLMQPDSLLLPLFIRAVNDSGRNYDLRPPRLSPALGAAVLAASLAEAPLSDVALERLAR